MKKKYIIIIVVALVLVAVIIALLIYFNNRSETSPDVKITGLSSGGSDVPKVTVNCGFTPTSPYFNDVNASVVRAIEKKGSVTIKDCKKLVRGAARIAPYGRSRKLVIDEVSRCLCK